MKILILGAGRMGSFFTDLLSFDHEVAVLESDPRRMRFIYNALRLASPDEAWSDASQQITPDVLDYVLSLLVIRDATQTTENLSALRRQIDGVDEQLLELLAKRMRISREIGVYKKEHNMPILQSPRYGEILENRAKAGAAMDLNPDFVQAILKNIHEESVRQQMIVMNQGENAAES